jgi:demethylmenaquinone methyltransferase/2-methoxy-6-polyprenyl-1,4-benzoquinol methylase
MAELPVFRKHDRYKASSYRSYNFRMPSRYDRCVWMRFCQTALWDRAIVRELGHPAISALRILDVGCATGRLLQRLAEAGAVQLCGTDLAPRILDVAAEKLSRTGIPVDLRPADAEDRLPWESDSFDVVTLTGVLHHFFRPTDALAEIHRVLRQGGRLLVIDPAFFTPVRQVLNAVLRVAPHDGDCRFYSPARAASLLADVGFEVLHNRRVGWWAFLADGRRPGVARAAGDTASGGAAQQRHAAAGAARRR